jgi:hypothetical protein
MKLSGVLQQGSLPSKFVALGLLAGAVFLCGQSARAQSAPSSRILDISTLPVDHYTFDGKSLMDSPFDDFEADANLSPDWDQDPTQSATPSQTTTGTPQTGTTQTTTPASNSQSKQKKAAPTGTSNDRLFYVLPNFLTIEESEKLPPLTTKEKFAVTARGIYDPAEFGLTAIVALLGQASNSDPSYGQGLKGYAKRYATTYGDNVIENFMASAIFPTIFHQDPRFYQLGHGSAKARVWHAFSRAFITRSDSGDRHEFNISEVGGALAAAALSTYTYHPDSDRGFGAVISVWGTQVGWDVGTYILKEFWPDLRKKYSKHRGAAGDTTTIDATPAPASGAPATAPAQTPTPAPPPAPAPAPAPKFQVSL